MYHLSQSNRPPPHQPTPPLVRAAAPSHLVLEATGVGCREVWVGLDVAAREDGVLLRLVLGHVGQGLDGHVLHGVSEELGILLEGHAVLQEGNRGGILVKGNRFVEIPAL